MIPAPKALLSIHDVMPETLDRTTAILQRLASLGLTPPALLVVPGRDWTEPQLACLRQWERDGCELLAHGWLHATRPVRPWHRVHAALLSRNVAEHLALDRVAILRLMERSQRWFLDVGLQAPAAYVPPAWALGSPLEPLETSPYRCIETLAGVHLRMDQGSWRFYALPLAGFEADTGLRAAALGVINRISLRLARSRRLPLRIAIHPLDFELRLARHLEQLLRQRWEPLRYRELCA